MELINYINSLHNLNASGTNSLAESQANSSYFKDIYYPFPIVESLKSIVSKDQDAIIILTGHAEEDALTQVKKCKHYQSYLWGFHGWSNYRLIVAELSSGRIVHNRHGQILKKLVKKAIQ